MASIKFESVGLRSVKDAFANHSKNLQRKALRQAVTAGAKVVVRAAKASAPVRTGAVRRAIRSLRDKKESIAGRTEVRAISVFSTKGATYINNRANRRQGRVGQIYQRDPPEFYWKFNELGTVKQAAKPFIGPALAQNITQAIDAMKQKLQDLLLRNPGQLK